MTQVAGYNHKRYRFPETIWQGSLNLEGDKEIKNDFNELRVEGENSPGR